MDTVIETTELQFVSWDQAELGVFGIAKWRNGFEWPAARVKVHIPGFYGVVPRRDWREVSSIVEDDFPKEWRPFRDDAERARWAERTGVTLKRIEPAEQ